MNRRSSHSLRQRLGICILAALIFVLAAGAAHAQVVIIEDDAISMDAAGGQTVLLYAGGDLYLGGNGWTGELYLKNSSNAITGSWIAANLRLGGGNTAGGLTVRDNDGLTTTIALRGQYGEIRLGGSGSHEDGDITVLAGDGTPSFEVDGDSGNVTNWSNGNGLIKAWARINSDGTVASCWRCNTNTSETGKVGTGVYHVDFFLGDITTRPLSAVVDSHTPGSIANGIVNLGYSLGDASSVWVITRFQDSNLDRSFTLMVY